MPISIVAICLLITPLIIFSMKPDASPFLKSARLLFLIIIFTFALMREAQIHQCDLDDCWPFIGMGMLAFIWGLGLCELAWRNHYKQFSWSLDENIKYGLSNGVIILSFFMTGFIFYFTFNR